MSIGGPAPELAPQLAPEFPPELSDLLERLRRRGLGVTPLEIRRLQRLLALDGALGCPSTGAEDNAADDGRLPKLLMALLCKDERGRRLFRREYQAWAEQHEGGEAAQAAAPRPERQRPDSAASDALFGSLPRLGPMADAARPSRRARLATWARVHWRPIAAAPLLPALGLTAWLLWPEPPPPRPALTGAGTATSAPAADADCLCPQALHTRWAPQVWGWQPVPDNRPWAVLGGALLLLALALLARRRLGTARHRWLPPDDADDADTDPPSRALPEPPVHGDLLLSRDDRRELVWSVDHYVSDDPDQTLDAEATVAAIAAAAGAPHLVQAARVFPRQVWLWCDRKTARPDLLERLVLELERALQQANLPVRIARFHGLPASLTWADSGEPFAPGCHEGGGAEALVAVLTDGTALAQAWSRAGERPRMQPLLRTLRAWPRLVLVDLGDGTLTRLAQDWRLPARPADGLATWLASAAVSASAAPSFAQAAAQATAPPDPAQLDLWAAGCLLAPRAPGQAEAEALRRAMALRVGPFDYRPLAERLDACAEDQRLAARLLGRLARSQPQDRAGLPTGDGYLTRALGFWQARLEHALQGLPEAETAGRDRLRIAIAGLQLWYAPEQAAETLASLRGRRNRAAIRGLLGRGPIGLGTDLIVDPATGLGPTWDAARLDAPTRWRLRRLGLGRRGSAEVRLRQGLRHHLALALLTGVALAGLGWGIERLVRPHGGGTPVFAEHFQDQVLRVDSADDTLGGQGLGSPWRLHPRPALGPLPLSYTWRYRPAANAEAVGDDGLLLTSGIQAFPIRACVPGWPRRALALIAAPGEDPDAKQLATRLLDRGSADRVLFAPNWRSGLSTLTQGVRIPSETVDDRTRPGDQLLLFLPPTAPLGPTAALARRFDAVAVIRGELSDLAAALDFHGARTPARAWPTAVTATLTGSPQVVGGPERTDDAKTGVSWLRLCGGTFLMGSPADEDRFIDRYAQGWVDADGGTLEERQSDVRRWMAVSRPAHPVLLEPFEIAHTELTGAQWLAVDGAAASATSEPVTDINWDDAWKACQSVDGASTLPTEAQWEYAARAGTATPWSFGETLEQIGDYGWYRDNSEGAAQPVATKRPNPLCLADMHGNVWEWTADCFDAQAYRGRGPLTIDEPDDATGECARRVVRGGAFGNPPFFLRSADRYVVVPEDRFGNLGLRCVRSGARQR